MKKTPNPNIPQTPNRSTKTSMIVVLSLAILTIFTTSCYTTQRCPAYGHTAQVPSTS